MSMKIFGSGSVFPHDPADDHVTQSGGGDTFIVTLTYPDEDSIRVDKTFAEIADAVERGAEVRLVYKDEECAVVYYFKSYEAGRYVNFSNFGHAGQDLADLTTYYVYADGTVINHFYELNLDGTGPAPV